MRDQRPSRLLIAVAFLAIGVLLILRVYLGH